MHRVIILDNIAQQGLDLLDDAEGIEYEVRTGLKGHDLQAALQEFDGAVCRSGVKITPDALDGNNRLRVIVRAGVGTDNIDKVAATRRGIIVMNTPTGNTLSTAEHAMALMLGLSRHVAPAFHSLQQGRWDRKQFMGAQLAGKTLGIIGLGRIGQEVARRAGAFSMRVIGYDPFFAADQAERLGVELVSDYHDMLAEVDYLTVHTPLTNETRHMISHAELATCKPTVRLINAARGGIYDEQAVAEALRDGRIAGVALDVYENEPCTDSPLFQMERVLCTPHLGASTAEAQTQVAVEAVHLLLRFFATGEIRHPVNMVAVDSKTLAAVRGYLDVAYRLGRLLAQWAGGTTPTCRITYRGEVAAHDTRLLTGALCAGLLEEALDEDVNVVNSELLLKERGIQLAVQTETGMGDFSSSITAQLDDAEELHVVSGTLFGNTMPRLIRVGPYRLESYLDGKMLIFVHRDVPGIIGKVGSVFGSNAVNIGQMSVGRAGDAPGGTSIGILNLDSVPSDAVLQEVLTIEGIESVRLIQLPAARELPAWLQGLV